MFDTHLINVAIAGLSISAGLAILVAAAIVAIAAIRQHRKTTRRGKLAAARPTAPVHPEVSTQAKELERQAA